MAPLDTLPITFGQASTTAPGGPETVGGDDGRTSTKLLVVGSGPSGPTAAVYAARADLQPNVLPGPAPGGRPVITCEIETNLRVPGGCHGRERMGQIDGR